MNLNDPTLVCPSCDSLATGALGQQHDTIPRPGDLSICIHCLSVNSFEKAESASGLKLVAFDGPTPVEVLEMLNLISAIKREKGV